MGQVVRFPQAPRVAAVRDAGHTDSLLTGITACIVLGIAATIAYLICGR